MNIELSGNCEFEYIKFLSKILGAGIKFPETLCGLIDEGYISNYFLSSKEIMGYVQENNEDFGYNRLCVEVSNFKKKGLEVNLFNNSNDDIKNNSRDFILNNTLFTQNGVMKEDQTNLILEFINGQVFAYNPTFSEIPQLLRSGIDGVDYYTILTMMDKKINARDLTISKTLELFKDGSYEYKKNNKDYIEAGFKFIHNLKNKLIKGRNMGVLNEETPLLFSLNQDFIPSVEWLKNFENEEIKLLLEFKNNQVIIKKI